jgi:hypothetical protein
MMWVDSIGDAALDLHPDDIGQQQLFAADFLLFTDG